MSSLVICSERDWISGTVLQTLETIKASVSTVADRTTTLDTELFDQLCRSAQLHLLVRNNLRPYSLGVLASSVNIA